MTFWQTVLAVLNLVLLISSFLGVMYAPVFVVIELIDERKWKPSLTLAVIVFFVSVFAAAASIYFAERIGIFT